MSLNEEALRRYTELVKEIPIPGISNDELADMMSAEELQMVSRIWEERAKMLNGNRLIAVRSPWDGIVQMRPSNDSPRFINEGDKVEYGQELCLIESMCVPGPFPYPERGNALVVEILVGDTEEVKKGTLLFILQPC